MLKRTRVQTALHEQGVLLVLLYIPSTRQWVQRILWNLDSNCKVQRTKFAKFVTADAVITQVNRIVEEEVKRCEIMLKPVEVEEVQDINPEGEAITAEIQGPVTVSTQKEWKNQRSLETVKSNSGKIITRPSRFLGVTKVPNLYLKAVETRKTVSAELRQIYEDSQARCPVLKESFSPNDKVLKSHMFIVEKILG
jgi:hypothetical protein